MRNPNVTPRAIKASGARDAHGRILDPSSGSLYVHMHRENGLAHRHYVLQPWKVRFLAIFLSRPLLAVYALGLLAWGWMAGQAARVPMLQQRVSELTEEAERLDTLTAAITELQARYAQVQRMLGAKSPESAAAAPLTPATPATTPSAASTVPPTKAPAPTATRAPTTTAVPSKAAATDGANATKDTTTRSRVPNAR